MGWEGHLLSVEGSALGTPGLAPEDNSLAVLWCLACWSFKVLQEPLFKGFISYISFQVTRI